MIKQDKTYMTLLEVSLTTGILISAIVKRFSPFGTMKVLAGSTLLTASIFQATTTVHLVNVKMYNSSQINNNKNYAAVDNVPYILAFLGSSFSTLGYGSARLIEDALHIASNSLNISFADDMQATSFLKTGLNTSQQAYKMVNFIKIEAHSQEASELINIYKSYNQLCVKEIAYPLNRDEVFDRLQNSKNFLWTINPNREDNPYFSVVKNEKVWTKYGEMTCGEFWNKAKDFQTEFLSNTNIDELITNYMGRYYSNPMEVASATVSMFGGAVGNSPQEKVKNYMLQNAYIHAFNAPWSVVGQQGAYASGLMLSQMQAQGEVNSQTASVILPAMHHVFQTFIYASFPILFLIAIASASFKPLQQYIMAMLWVEMWAPSFSIFNFITQYSAASQATDQMISAANAWPTDNALSMESMNIANSLYTTVSTYGAIASELMWSVPILAGFLMYGSFSALQNMTRGFMASAGTAGNIDYQMDQKALSMAADRMNQSLNANMSAGESMTMSKMLNNVDNFSKFKGVNSLGMDSYTNMKALDSLYKNSENASFYSGFDSENAMIGNALTAGQARNASIETSNQTYSKNLKNFGGKDNMIDQVSTGDSFNQFKGTSQAIENQNKYQEKSSKFGDINGDGIIDFKDTTKHITKGLADHQTAKDIGVSNKALETNDDTQITAAEKETAKEYLKTKNISEEDYVRSAQYAEESRSIQNIEKQDQEQQRASEQGKSWKEYKTGVEHQLARQSVIENEATAQTVSKLSNDKLKDLALHGEETKLQKEQHQQSQTQKENETFANNIEKIVGPDMQKDLVQSEIDRLKATSEYKNAGDATVAAAAQSNVFKALASDSIYNANVTKSTVDKQMAAFASQEEAEKMSSFMSGMSNEDKSNFSMAQHASKMLQSEDLSNAQKQYWSNVYDENAGVFEKDYQSFLKSDEAAAISSKYNSQREDFKQAIFTSGAVRAGVNGQFEYKDTVKDLRNGELDLNKNLELRETWGQRDGSKISTVDIKGRDVTLSDDVRGQTMTDFVKAQRGQYYEGQLKYDPTFFVDEKIDRDNRTIAAVGVSAFETALKTVGIGKFVAGARSMNSMSKALDDVAENTKKPYWNFKAHKKGDE